MSEPDRAASARSVGFQARYKIGETPPFPVEHVALEATWDFAAARSGALFDASLAAARRTAAVAASEGLARAAALAAQVGEFAHPWARWIDALARTHGLDGLSIHVEEEGGMVRLRIPTSYPAVVARWGEAGLDLLLLARATIEGGSVAADSERWRKRLAAFDRGLPDAPTRALHSALSERNLFWAWRDGAPTMVGSGSRQRPVEAGADPQAIAGSIAALDPMVPVYAVTGSVGKTTTVRMIAQLLESTRLRLGITASDGAWAAGHRIAEGDQIAGVPARRVLGRPDVDVAVLEYGRGALIAGGMPRWSVDVGLLVNIDDAHLTMDSITTRAQMADVKALMLAPARLAVLNRDDSQCRRVGALRDASTCAWFSLTASAAALRRVSRSAAGAAGVERGEDGAPAAIALWRAGRREHRLSLDGVAPFHGLLGEKTLEELLGAVASVAFGPVPVADLEAGLRALRLDSENHSFRASVHRNGDIFFMLDKGAEDASLRHLQTAVEAVCAREGIGHRLCVVTRGAVEAPEVLYGACARLHRFCDSFVCFDRPNAYAMSGARPDDYPPGSIPHLLKAEIERLNRAAGIDKPVVTMPDWDAAEAHLRTRLADATGKMLVLINQPSSSQADLNRRIVDFVSEPLD
jgi:hypothetical protein